MPDPCPGPLPGKACSANGTLDGNAKRCALCRVARSLALGAMRSRLRRENTCPGVRTTAAKRKRLKVQMGSIIPDVLTPEQYSREIDKVFKYIL